jgi:D-mannonate dehydratase
MPVIDWTRTDLNFRLPNGAYALRFDQEKVAAFDLFVLRRDNVDTEYSQTEIVESKQIFTAMSEAERVELTENIIAGLPDKMTDSYSLDDFRAMLSCYGDVSHDSRVRICLLFYPRCYLVPKRWASNCPSILTTPHGIGWGCHTLYVPRMIWTFCSRHYPVHATA